MRTTSWKHLTAALSAFAIAGCVAGDPGASSSRPDPDDLASAAAPTAMPRPDAVPVSYVATPYGWVDPSCVHALADGDRVLDDGHVAHADGSVQAARPCGSPRYSADGVVVDPGRAGGEQSKAVHPPSATQGWIEYADVASLGPASYLQASWTVPPAPVSTAATVYFFPGLQSATTINTPILQPVLGWNQYGGPAGAWSLESWDCCNDGYDFSAAIPASPGNAVSGDMTGTSCNASGVCTSWTIVSHNLTTGRSTTLQATSTLAQDYILPGVLETYGVTDCTQLPATGPTFTNLAIRSAPSGASLALPTWRTHVMSATPACGYAINASPSAVTIGVNLCTVGDQQECCAYPGGCSCSGEETCRANGTWGPCTLSAPKNKPCP